MSFESLDLTIIKGVVGAAADICLFIITVYTFRLTVFPKKLKFISFRQSMSVFGGDSFEIILENRALSPTVVQSISLVFDSNIIEVYSGACIIDGFKTAKFEIEPYSAILSAKGEINISAHSLSDMELWVKTSQGFQQIKYKNPPRFFAWYMHKMKSRKERATVYRNHFNGKLVTPTVKYALSYIDKKDKLHTVFINKSGVMSEILFDCRCVPMDLLDDEKALLRFFDEMFSDTNYWHTLQRMNGTLLDGEAASAAISK